MVFFRSLQTKLWVGVLGRCRRVAERERDQASLLFQVICSRYEKQAATIITSNKAFADWGHVFAGDAVMASAALDRLLHRATVINIKGDSYRMREKRLTGLFPGTVALPNSPKGGLRTKSK